jgi:hypothetical protein
MLLVLSSSVPVALAAQRGGGGGATTVSAAPAKGTAKAGSAKASPDKATANQLALQAIVVDLGVPTSPAFALLPDQPTQVTHVTTPKDIQAQAASWFDGAKINSGIALDVRPFAALAGSLTQYQASGLRRAAFRTVFSAGTDKRGGSSADVITAFGIRVPLLDRGDPRNQPAFIDSLIKIYLNTPAAAPPLDDGSRAPPGAPGFNDSDAQIAAFHKPALALMDAYRTKRKLAWWNAQRVDVGLAGSLVAKSATPVRDSLLSDRGGVWLAASGPILSRGQITAVGQLSWARAATDTSESARHLAGVSIRWFLNDWMSTSTEVARNWSVFHTSALNDSWTHIGIQVELKLPLINGWVDIAYGGDAGRHAQRDPAFTLKYAVFQDRQLKE